MINNGNAPGNFNKNINLNVNEINDDFGNYEGQNDSLLTLIRPELDMLSKNWQAALKDHALLLLPCGKYFYFKYNYNYNFVKIIIFITKFDILYFILLFIIYA